MLKKYSDLTYKVKHTITGYQKVVHVDRMKRKYSRDETVGAIGENIEKERQPETEPSTALEETAKISWEIFYDAEEGIESEEALGRGRRQKHPPQKYSDYVM